MASERASFRLHLRIYLTTLGALLGVVVICAGLWRYTTQSAAERLHDQVMAALIEQALPADASPTDLQRALSSLLSTSIDGVVLSRRDNTRLASAGNVPAGTDPAAAGSFGAYQDGFVWRRLPLSDGRLLAAHMRLAPMHLHLHALVLLTLVALVVAAATWPVARRLTRRLEQLTRDVDQFGAGDLSLRTDPSSHDEVGHLALAFNRMADRIEKLVAGHRSLLANASHELRSPLARVRLALDLYEAAPRPELLQAMRGDCAEIDAQVEEILLASKLDTCEFGLDTTAAGMEPVDLASLAAEESARLGIPFEVEPADVRGDPGLLRKLIRNLVENARKYGGEDLATRVRVATNGERILEVSDRGPGIAEDELERIFQPFYRPANARETGSGWGLGLSLVRQIATRHGGRVHCLPRDGGGCVFQLLIPAPTPAPESQATDHL